MSYASDTSVPVERSQREIEQLVAKHGATAFYRGQDGTKAVVGFQLNDRRIMFEVPLPTLEETRGPRSRKGSQEKLAQIERSRWRALALTIKAKLVSVESGVETFEEAFLAQIVVPSEGRAVPFGQVALPAIVSAYGKGRLPPLLPGGTNP